MRIYDDFPEALDEIRRDVAEMGILVHANTWQDVYVGNDESFKSLELQNYVYQVLESNPDHLDPTMPWAQQEWNERVTGIESGKGVNPGTAWISRQEVWEQFLHKSDDDEVPKFGYTYSERLALHNQAERVINRLKEDEDSRQLYISIWDPSDSENLGGVSRVPCTLGYLLQVRRGHLNTTYLQRSADLITHFENDVFMACMLQHYISWRTGWAPGSFTHWIGSLHMFRKDAEGVF